MVGFLRDKNLLKFLHNETISTVQIAPESMLPESDFWIEEVTLFVKRETIVSIKM